MSSPLLDDVNFSIPAKPSTHIFKLRVQGLFGLPSYIFLSKKQNERIPHF